MRRSNDFSLYTISGVPYLLPFGQGIADLRRGIQVNETGAYLWGLLDRERTEDEMLSLCAAYYEVSDSQLPKLKSDLQQFFSMLDAFGMLDQSGVHTDSDDISGSGEASACHISGNPSGSDAISRPQIASAYHISDKPSGSNKIWGQDGTGTVRRYLSVGGLTLLLRGPDNAFSQAFDAFEIFPVSAVPVDQTVTVTLQPPAECALGKALLINHELTVLDSGLQYIFLFPNAPGIRRVCLTKDGTEACFYCCPPFTEDFRQDLFHAIRLSFLYLAQLHDMIVLHSASLLYRDRAWLFSGHSGAGKSTHTNLWKECYHVPLINGDLNLLSMENGCPMVHGLPWCGTSGIVDTRSYPLGGILLIKKDLQNHIASLDESHAQLLVSQRLISPTWTEAMLGKNLRLVAELTPHILICRLHCTKTPEAAGTAKQAIDAYLEDGHAGH